MMPERPAWQVRNVPFKFQLSDWTLFSLTVPLQSRQVTLAEVGVPHVQPVPPAAPAVPTDALAEDCEGFVVHSMPLAAGQPKLQFENGYLCYVQSQYPHFYIELASSFEDYKATFSTKSRSTIQRKVRRFAEHTGGTIDWRIYRTPKEMTEFFALAREVSQKTYQEKVLDAGLPESLEFQHDMLALAAADAVRAFILFDAGKPVSYLYCPAEGKTLIYAYLGYDPAYLKLSVGTVLQWLALEALFAEKSFLLFDFTEGESEHKRLFSTNSVPSANVVFLRNRLRNRVLVCTQLGINQFSQALGVTLDQLGVKAQIKRLLRAAA